MRSLSLFGCLLLVACTGVPPKVTPVAEVDLDRYLGQWFEIARLDHSFERNLSRVTADYSWREDGGIRVINRGYNELSGAWEEAEGKAYPNGRPGEGRLKVSFFGPFYGAYNIIALDREHYQWAMVCGPDLDYLWILAREPRLASEVRDKLLLEARAAGFETDRLIWVAHE